MVRTVECARTDLETPDGWTRLGHDERSSTISSFVGGAARAEGDEVLVWASSTIQGADVRSHLGNDVPDGSSFVIERHQDGDLVEERFVASLDEAVQAANDLLAGAENGGENE